MFDSYVLYHFVCNKQNIEDNDCIYYSLSFYNREIEEHEWKQNFISYDSILSILQYLYPEDELKDFKNDNENTWFFIEIILNIHTSYQQSFALEIKKDSNLK